jgi:dTDP-4-dehydrorhamnose reductase
MASPQIRLLVTGGTGLLGGAVLAQAAPPGVDAPEFDLAATWLAHDPGQHWPGVRWSRADLRVPGEIAHVIRAEAPHVVLHTAVSVESGDLERVIVRGSAEGAGASQLAGAQLIHVSSDMVFDGASGPYDEASPPSPITDYGRAKTEAEEAVRRAHPGAWIARSSLLYRLDPPDRSLGGWLAGLDRGDAYPLFEDEIRCPAQVDDVARALLELARRAARGTWSWEDLAGTGARALHIVGPRPITRYEFGRLVLRALGRDPALATKARSADSGAVRPRELVLVARATPAWLVAGLRAPEDALKPAG